MNGPAGRAAPDLVLCRACSQFVLPGTVRCVHCGADVAVAAIRHERLVEEAREAARDLEALLEGLRSPPARQA